MRHFSNMEARNTFRACRFDGLPDSTQHFEYLNSFSPTKNCCSVFAFVSSAKYFILCRFYFLIWNRFTFSSAYIYHGKQSSNWQTCHFEFNVRKTQWRLVLCNSKCCVRWNVTNISPNLVFELFKHNFPFANMKYNKLLTKNKMKANFFHSF